MLRDHLVFLREFIAEFEHTGTVWPTSAQAARTLAHPLLTDRGPKTILEIGPGTGSVTVEILRHMQPGDHLTVCEINPRFMKALKENLAGNPDFERHRENIFFFEGPVQNLPEDRHFDVIVRALPFLNFELSIVQEIFEKLRRVSTSETVMTYYEYIGLRQLGKVVPSKKARMRELDPFFKAMHSRHRARRTRVWWNLLPINIYRLQLDLPG